MLPVRTQIRHYMKRHLIRAGTVRLKDASTLKMYIKASNVQFAHMHESTQQNISNQCILCSCIISNMLSAHF